MVKNRQKHANVIKVWPLIVKLEAEVCMLKIKVVKISKSWSHFFEFFNEKNRKD